MRENKEVARLYRCCTSSTVYIKRHPRVKLALDAKNKAAEAAGLDTCTLDAFVDELWDELTLAKTVKYQNLALAKQKRVIAVYDQWHASKLALDEAAAEAGARRVDTAGVSERDVVSRVKRAAAVEAKERLHKLAEEEEKFAREEEEEDEVPVFVANGSNEEADGTPPAPAENDEKEAAPLPPALDAQEEEEEDDESSDGKHAAAHPSSSVHTQVSDTMEENADDAISVPAAMHRVAVRLAAMQPVMEAMALALPSTLRAYALVEGAAADVVDADDAISAPALQLAAVQPEAAAVALAPLAPLHASALLISAAELVPEAAHDDAMAVDAPPLLLQAPSDSGLAHLLQRAAPEVASGSTSASTAAAEVVFDGGAGFAFPAPPPPAPTAAEAEAAYAAAGGEAHEAALLAAREAARAHPLAGNAAGDAAEEARLAAATAAFEAAARLEARLNAAARDAKAARVSAEAAEQLARDAGAIRKRRRDAEDVYDAFRARHG